MAIHPPAPPKIKNKSRRIVLRQIFFWLRAGNDNGLVPPGRCERRPAQAEGFQMPDQGSFAGTGFGKGPYPAKERNQRQYRRKWRGVEITLTSLKAGSLTHPLP